jgi:hypothetical protein
MGMVLIHCTVFVVGEPCTLNLLEYYLGEIGGLGTSTMVVVIIG